MNVIYRMFIYDFMYVMGDLLIKKYNPCQIQTSRSGAFMYCLGDTGPCCNNCIYLSSTGCTVACLGCKLGLCRMATDMYPELVDKLLRIKRIKYYGDTNSIRVSRSNTYARFKMTRNSINRAKDRRQKKCQLDTSPVKKRK